MKSKNFFSISSMLVLLFLAGCKKDDATLNPKAESTNPVNNVTGVARNTAVEFTFSEAMNPSTISASTFTLKQGNTAVPGAVTHSGKTATFTRLLAQTAVILDANAVTMQL